MPVYPLTEDLRAEQLRPHPRAVDRDATPPRAERPAGDLRHEARLPGVAAGAARRPLSRRRSAAATQARRRFIYEEFLVLQLALALRRRELRDRAAGPGAAGHAEDRRPHPPAVPVRADRRPGPGRRRRSATTWRSDRPMQRLLQADVGAGKTAVAVYALLVAVANKHQAALMAPTEVLARQHWRTLERLPRPEPRPPAAAHRRPDAARAAATPSARSAGGEVDLVVGTQALVQEDVEFAQLGLVVIDEQHKFGVNQRARIRQLGVDPHYLVMTATPIPRTVALTVFGDLDVSRHPRAAARPAAGRRRAGSPRRSGAKLVRASAARSCARAGRRYVVCPLVEESETLGPQGGRADATRSCRPARSRTSASACCTAGMDDEAKDSGHGRASATARLDLLVSTTVIEVGVDVPNATLMVIEHAERFGLSQLHQLRGRVSRGPVAGECYLFAEPTNDETQRAAAHLRPHDATASPWPRRTPGCAASASSSAPASTAWASCASAT